DQRRQVLLCDALHLGACRLAALDQFHEKRTGVWIELDVLPRHSDRAHVRTRGDGERSSDDADPAIARRFDGCSNGRFDHFDEGDVRIRVTDVIEPGTRCGVARDHQHLHAFIDEQPCYVVHIAPNFVTFERPVRPARGIAVVDDRFAGEVVEQRAGDGQAAEPGVENADRSVIHLFRSIRARSYAQSMPSRRFTAASKSPPYAPVERYFHPPSGSKTTTVPFASRSATRRAT